VGTGKVDANGDLTGSITVDASEPVGSDPIVAIQGDLSVTVPFTVDTTPFGVAPITLPAATRGQPYGTNNSIVLQAIGIGTSSPSYTTTLKWKKVSLPKGLTLTSTGVLSGTPSSKLIPGKTSITVKVTETVPTVSGKTTTAVKITSPPAVIALTIG
jgi:hypothetical protein